MLPPRQVIHVHVGKKEFQKQIKKKHQMNPGEFQNNMMKKWGW